MVVPTLQLPFSSLKQKAPTCCTWNNASAMEWESGMLQPCSLQALWPCPDSRPGCRGGAVPVVVTSPCTQGRGSGPALPLLSPPVGSPREQEGRGERLWEQGCCCSEGTGVCPQVSSSQVQAVLDCRALITGTAVEKHRETLN